MSDESTLELRTVRKRFESADEVLRQLREKIHAIALAEESAERSATSIDQAGEAIGHNATSLTAHTDALVRAQQSLLAALEVAEARLQTFEPDSVIEAIGEARADTNSRCEALEDQLKVLANEVTKIATTTQEQIAWKVEEVAKLRAQIDALPPRVRAKHGL